MIVSFDSRPSYHTTLSFHTQYDRSTMPKQRPDYADSSESDQDDVAKRKSARITKKKSSPPISDDNRRSSSRRKLKEGDDTEDLTKEGSRQSLKKRGSSRHNQEAANGENNLESESRGSFKKETSKRRSKSQQRKNKDDDEDDDDWRMSLTKDKHHFEDSPKLKEGDPNGLRREESRKSLKKRRNSRNHQEADGEEDTILEHSEESPDRSVLKKESSRRKKSQQSKNKGDEEDDDDCEDSHETSTSISLGDGSRNQMERQQESKKKRNCKKNVTSNDEDSEYDSEIDLEIAKRNKKSKSVERQESIVFKDVSPEAEDPQHAKDWSNIALILICIALVGAALGLLVVVLMRGSGSEGSSDEQQADPIRTTPAPTISTQPTASPAPSASPTSSPAPTVSRFSTLETLLKPFLVFVDTAQPETPQYRALSWLADEDPAQLDLEATPNKVLLERYVMSVFYFATMGEEWEEQIYFLSGSSTCAWRFGNSFATRGVVCGSENQLRMIQIVFKNVGGTLPTELGLLSDLEEILLGANSIGGTLPSELGNLSKLSNLSMGK